MNPRPQPVCVRISPRARRRPGTTAAPNAAPSPAPGTAPGPSRSAGTGRRRLTRIRSAVNIDSRSAIVAGGAPSWDWKSVNRLIPTNAATRSRERPPVTDDAHRLREQPGLRSARIGGEWWHGTDRRQDPLGPHCATRSFSLDGPPHELQVTCGAKSLATPLWRMPGSCSVWSGTQDGVPTPRSTPASATATGCGPSPDTQSAADSSGSRDGRGVRLRSANAADR